MGWDPRTDLTQAAERIRGALTRLGYCYRTKNGDLIEVSYRQLGLVGDQYGVLEVDVQRLPPRVSIEKLTHGSTLHHLTAVVGKPVHKLNTTGLSYCVELQPRPRRRLPSRVLLDIDGRPEGEYMVPIGRGHDGDVWRSLLDTSHILVGGESRSGKSTWVNAALIGLLCSHQPEALRLVIVDPKGVDFTPYRHAPHLLRPVATTPTAASAVSSVLVSEMERRRELFAEVYARNLSSYNVRVAEQGGEPLPLIVAVVDEVADIALQCGLKSTFYKNLIRLSSKGAALGLVLILATQNPKAQVLNTLIRGNMSTRIAFRVATVEHSRTILGRGGAQELPRSVRGRMMARLDRSLTQLQGYYVPDERVLALARGWADRSGRALTRLEQEMVRYAQTELEGKFPIRKMHARFGEDISYRQMVKLGRQLEREGLLTRPPSAAEARRVTDKLAQLAAGE